MKDVIVGNADYCTRTPGQCDGNVPCRACISKRRDCQQNGTDMRGRWRKAGRDSAERFALNQLLSHAITRCADDDPDKKSQD